MKYLFGFFLLIHGLIHLMGFVKAFGFAEINQLSQRISKPAGLLWLMTTLLFFIATALYLSKIQRWYLVAFVAVLISQILIFSYWKDAKFGTILNIIILFACIITHGSHMFHLTVQQETENLMTNTTTIDHSIISNEDIMHLPPIVQQWMCNAQVVGSQKIRSAYLTQIGQMKIKPTGPWMPFTATQYFKFDQPAFIWEVKVEANNVFYMLGRDKLLDGNGEMLIKLLGVLPIVHEKNNIKIDQGTLIRFLSELCWFPSAALNSYITWEPVHATAARATLKVKDTMVSGIFQFKPNGEIISFEAQRYYGGGTNARMENWSIEMMDYKVFNGFNIPNKCHVIWRLKNEDYHWLQVEINTLELNS